MTKNSKNLKKDFEIPFSKSQKAEYNGVKGYFYTVEISFGKTENSYGVLIDDRKVFQYFSTKYAKYEEINSCTTTKDLLKVLGGDCVVCFTNK